MAVKSTLLDIVQDILSDMESDEVNSIDDTYEALQVAGIIASSYNTMLANRNWPHTRRTIHLDASTSTDRPSHMSVPENVKEVELIKYNKALDGETRKKYRDVNWKEPDAFLRYTNVRNNDNANIDVITDPSGVELLIRNDEHPTCYTSFNDVDIVFDSYNSDVDDTLQSSKTQAIVFINLPKLTIADDTIPDLPAEAFPALIENARTKCMLRLAQKSDPTAAQDAASQKRWLSRKAFTVNGGVRYPNYGRRGRGGYRRDATFKQNREG